MNLGVGVDTLMVIKSQFNCNAWFIRALFVDIAVYVCVCCRVIFEFVSLFFHLIINID